MKTFSTDTGVSLSSNSSINHASSLTDLGKSSMPEWQQPVKESFLLFSGLEHSLVSDYSQGTSNDTALQPCSE